MSAPCSNLTGVIAASVTPFNTDCSIDRTALSENIRFLINYSRFRGVLINGLAGEVTSLSRKERADVIGWARDELPDGYALISGISAQSTREAVEMAKEAEGAGADMLLVTAPGLFSRGGASDPEAPVHFFDAIAKAVKTPLLIFQHQANSGLCYPEATLIRICSIPNVLGIKSTVWDQERYEREWSALKAMPNPPLVFSGNDTLLLGNFVSGCDGAILGIANLLPEPVLDLFEQLKSGNLNQARSVYRGILPVVHAIYRPPAFHYYSRMKEAMVMLGLLKNATVRPPLLAATGDERALIRKTLKTANLL